MNACLQCQTPTSNLKFCSRSCSGLFHGPDLPKRPKSYGSCLVCQVKIPGSQKFCCRSHSAHYNNKIFRKRPRSKQKENLGVQCWYCAKVFDAYQFMKKYCGEPCQRAYEHREFIQKWKSGEISGSSSGTVAAKIRRYLLDKQNGCCAVCNISSWQNKPITLQVDHIDGHHDNNTEKNLWMICANCHAQRPTSGGRNRGQGRAFRSAFSKITSEHLRAAHKKLKDT